MPQPDQGPGYVGTIPPTDGQSRLQALQQGGFTSQEQAAYKQERSQALLQGGFSQSDVDAYWGDNRPPSPTILATTQSAAQRVFQNAAPAAQQQEWSKTLSPWDYFTEGARHSATGLVESGGADTPLDPRQGTLGQGLAFSAGQIIGDLPFMIGGTIAAARTPFGKTGAGFAGVALPEATRNAMIIAHNRGEIHNFGDVVSTLSHAGWDTVQQGANGGLGFAAEAPAGAAAVKAGLGPWATRATELLANTLTQLGTGSAQQGHMPTDQDYITAFASLAVGHAFLAGEHGPAALARFKSNAQRIYADTGIPPALQVKAARANPQFEQELLSQDSQGDPVAPSFRAQSAHEFSDPSLSAGAPTTPEANPFGMRLSDEDREDLTVRPQAPSVVADVNEALGRFRSLEGSGDAAVSQAGAIGRYQIMPQTARAYGFDPTRLKDPAYNEQVARSVVQDLMQRYHGNFDAMAIAYNAGPKRAGEYLAAGPGTRLEALQDPSVRGGYRYVRVTATKDESGLPLETQHYLAINRQRFGAANEPLVTDGPVKVPMDATGRARLGQLRANPEGYLSTLLGRKVTITSAERSVGENASLPGASRTSEHLPGNFAAGYGAWDIKVAGMTNTEVIQRLARSGLPYDQLIEEGDHVHVGFGPRTRNQIFTMRNGKVVGSAEGGGGEGAPAAAAPGEPPKLPSWSDAGLEPSNPLAGEEEPSIYERVSMGGIGAQSVWDSAPVETSQQEILSNIGEQPQADWRQLAQAAPDKMADALFAINPARRLDTELARNDLLDRNEDFGVEDAFRQTFASANRAEVFVRYGQIDGPNQKNIIEGSHSLMNAVKAMKEDGGDPDGFRAYLLAARTMDKQAQGIDTGINPFAAKRIAEDAGEQKKYQRAASIWTNVFNGSLDYAKESGRYSDAQIEAMKELNPVYVSFRRIMGDDSSFRAKGGYGFTLGNPLKRMEGSDRQITDPLLASVDNMRLVIASADQNWARGHVIQMVESDPKLAAALGMHKVEAGGDGENGALVDRVLAPYRDQMTSDEYEQARQALEPLAATQAEKGFGDNEFAYYRDGKLERWTTASPEFAQMMRGSLTREETGMITAVFQKIAAAGRAGVVIMPDFPVRNIVSHQIIQFINDPSHPPPFMAPIKGLMSALKVDHVYQDAMAKGALGAAVTDMDKDYLARDMDKLFDEGGIKDRLWNFVSSPFEAARFIQERGDVANRIGLYQRFQDEGLTAQKAAMRSRTAGIDYAERLGASSLKWWARTTPFFKAKLLYLNQAAQAWKENPLQTAAYATAAVALPTAIAWVLRQQQDPHLPPDRRSDNVDRWEKDYGIVLPEIAGVRLRIRYPEATGLAFGAMVDRTLDAMFKHDPKAMKDWMGAVMANLPIEGPPALQAPAENATNFSLMTGHPIIPSELSKLNKQEFAYTPNTTPEARSVAQLLDPAARALNLSQISPMALDHLAQSWTGTAGVTLLRTLGAPFNRPGPPTDWTELPGVQSFFARHPGLSGQVVSDYYDEKDNFDSAMTERGIARREARAGMTDMEMRDEAISTTQLARFDQRLNRVSGALNVVRSAIWGVAESKMTPEEKQRYTDTLTANGVQLAHTTTTLMRAIEHGTPEERRAALQGQETAARDLETTFSQMKASEAHP